jgi:hypothetical protein
MHVTKNVFDNIIEILLDMPRKIKDRLKSRNDLVQFGLRPELHPKLRLNGKHYLPPTSYSLTVEEKKYSVSACVGWAPTGFSSNITKLVSVKELSMPGYNSHNCHMMMMVFSRNRNKGHQTDVYQSTHRTLVLLFQYNFTEGDWS